MELDERAAAARIRISREPGIVRYDFGRCREPLVAAQVGLLGLVFGAVASAPGVLAARGALPAREAIMPTIIGAIFAIAALALLAASARYALARERVVVDRGRSVALRSTVLGLGRTRRYAAERITDIAPDARASVFVLGGREKALTRIVLVLRRDRPPGPRVRCASLVLDDGLAADLAADMRRALFD